MKAFIVDDSALLRGTLIDMLREIEGVEVAGVAGDVPEALEAIPQVEPGVVILDVRLPHGSGCDVLEQIKRTRPQTVVIMLTSYAYPELRESCLAGGADFFLDKSSEFIEVATILRKLVCDASARAAEEPSRSK